ncbi:UNVERIFIED_CONTAM: Sorbitol dehydrogenase [Sesamum latifolium]|uniref:Sorbitol dehydrogenase n=1 Tax=Sesamum latifolium TaxID=2727402 RepID=A0AAW2T7V7_9LAMI
MKAADFVVTEPMVIGHECAGVVEEVGSEVKHLVPGDGVAIEPGISCLRCGLCKEGRYNLCPEMKFLATPPVHGSLANQGHWSETMNDERLSVAKELGADETIKVSTNINLKQDVSAEVEQIKKAMGAGIDISIDCAGFTKTLSTALNATSSGGKVCLVGLADDEMTIPLAPAAVRDVDLVGVFRYRNTWPFCIEFQSSGKIDVKPLITHRFGFSQEEVEEAFDTSARGGTAIKVMFNL